MKRQRKVENLSAKVSHHRGFRFGFESLEERIVLSAVSILDEQFLESSIDNSDSITAQTNEKPVVRDGNTYAGAKNLGKVEGVKTVHNYVGQGDRKDIYRFRISDPTEVRIKLKNLEADAELRLQNENLEVLKWSLRSGNQDEYITAELERGFYYIRVDAFDASQSGDYDLSLTTIDMRMDIGGDTIEGATELGEINELSDLHVSGWVGASDRWDYYEFYTQTFANVRMVLNQLSGNADMRLYDANQNEIANSSKPGRQVEQIVTDLSPGVYTIGIQGVSGNVYYSWSASSDPANTEGRLDNVEYYGIRARDANLNAIYAPEAWDAGHTGDDVIVAVIDTGVDYDHRDLKGQMWENKDEIAGDGIDNDNNGYIDDVRGWNFSDDNNNPDDKSGHGTHVAGLIASARNHYGATGIAYDAKIMAVRVLDNDGDGTFGQLAKGIYYAVDNGADVINLSVGGDYNYSVRSAIDYANSKGVFVSVATGNGGLEMPLYPARHSAALSNVLSVGAHNVNDQHVWFSNFVGQSGSVQVDAPGTNVYSTLPDDRYGRYSGTSTAASYVSGLAALVLSVNKDFSPNLVRHFISEGAIRKISGSDSIGGIDAARTLHLARKYNGNKMGSGFAGNDDHPGNSPEEIGTTRIQKQNLNLEVNVPASFAFANSSAQFRTEFEASSNVSSFAGLESAVMVSTFGNSTVSNRVELSLAQNNSDVNLVQEIDRFFDESDTQNEFGSESIKIFEGFANTKTNADSQILEFLNWVELNSV